MSTNKLLFVRALKFHWLTPLYEPMINLIPQYLRFHDQLIKQASLRSDERILDVGCGPGTLLRRINTIYPTIEATGLDLDSDMLAIAQEKSAKENLPIHYRQGSSNDLPFPSDSFDHVFSSLLFHHLPMNQKRETLLEIHRVLMGGGQAHILDFGRPKNILMKATFTPIRWFDGEKNAGPHAEGALEDLFIKSPFTHVRLTNRFNTPVGTLYAYQLIKL